MAGNLASLARSAVVRFLIAGVATYGTMPSVVADEPASSGTSEMPTCPPAAISQPLAPKPASPTAGPPGTAASDPAELTVFAAASLRAAFESLAPAHEAATGVDLVYSFDASSSLRAQIEQGAPADVFASADLVDARILVDAGLASDPVVFACNELTVIVPASDPAGIGTVEGLARPGVRVVAAGDGVPITRYATEVVEALGIRDAYEANVVSREDNVAAVRAKIELGEGDAAIVYVTDAVDSGDAVTAIAIPREANVTAAYVAVMVAGTDQPAESRVFLERLVGPEGQATLARFGFRSRDGSVGRQGPPRL